MRPFSALGRASRTVGVLCVAAVLLVIAGCGKSGPSAAHRKAMKYVKAGQDAHFGGDAKKGLACYNKAIQIDPECQQAYVRRGMLYSESGQPKKAIADFTKAIRLDPDDSYPYEQRALIYRSHFHDEAKAEADEAKAFEIRQKERSRQRKRATGR
jgi:Tfp pilus assembly protein PilF